MDGARTPRRVRARARARARSAGRRRPSAGRERTEGRVAVGSSRTPPVVGRGASSSDESAIVCAHGGGKKVRSRQSARSRDPSAGFQTRWSAGTSSRWRCIHCRNTFISAAGHRTRGASTQRTRRCRAGACAACAPSRRPTPNTCPPALGGGRPGLHDRAPLRSRTCLDRPTCSS